MLIPITYIDSEYSETGREKFDKAFAIKEETEEEKEQRKLEELLGKRDEDEPEVEILSVEFTKEDYILSERKGCLDTEEISYAFETEEGYTSIVTKGEATILIKEKVKHLLDKQ